MPRFFEDATEHKSDMDCVVEVEEDGGFAEMMLLSMTMVTVTRRRSMIAIADKISRADFWRTYVDNYMNQDAETIKTL